MNLHHCVRLTRKRILSLTQRWEARRQCLIQFHQPAYVLFPGEDPMDELNAVSTWDFPSLPTPPGFHHIMCPGDTPEPAGSPSLFDSSLELPGWYPLTHPVDARDVLTLSSPFSPVCLREFRRYACLPFPRWCLMGTRDS